MSICPDIYLEKHDVVEAPGMAHGFDHEGLRQVHTKTVLYVPDEDLRGLNVVLLQSILCYVRCSTSSVTLEKHVMAHTTSV